MFPWATINTTSLYILFADSNDGEGEKCTSEQFQCGEKTDKNPTGGKCIPKRWQCDYHRDCENGEDEYDCRKYWFSCIYYFISASL